MIKILEVETMQADLSEGDGKLRSYGNFVTTLTQVPGWSRCKTAPQLLLTLFSIV